MPNIVKLKSRLVKDWRDLKNDKLATDSRKAAYASIIVLSDEISELDSNFKMNTEMLKKYKEFSSKEIIPRVLWPEYDEIFGVDLEIHLEKLTALAVKITKKRLPREPQDSQLFGMVVSSTTDKLIALEEALI